MSPDVVKLQEDLIQMTRELAGAGDTATGLVDAENASGRAILAVQQASQAPMMEQKESTKNFIEDLANIYLEYLIVYSEDGIMMEEEIIDPYTGEQSIQMVNVPQYVLEELKASVRVDITPKGIYDKFAQEQSLENYLVNGLFNIQRLPELKAYVESLEDDSVSPKLKLEKVIKRMEEEQAKIAAIEAEAQLMQEKAQQFIYGDPDDQASQIAEAQRQLMAQEEEVKATEKKQAEEAEKK
jgi:hypothetical protein